MRHITLLILGFICATSHAADYQPAGFLEKHINRLHTPGYLNIQMYIYLPESYYESQERYPVVYMLHGAHGNEMSWIRKGRILQVIDSLRALNQIKECIYVFPNLNQYGNYYDYYTSQEMGIAESFMGLNGKAEDRFLDEVVKYIDGRFRTKAEKDSRGLIGLSIGGMQSLYISANNPELFGAVYLLSPIIRPPALKNIGNPVYADMRDKVSRQFKSPPATYRIMIGIDDIFFDKALRFSEFLKDKKFRYDFTATAGGHTWKNWRDYSIESLKDFLAT